MRLLGAQVFLADSVGFYTVLGLLGFVLLVPRKLSAEMLGEMGKIMKEMEDLPSSPCGSARAGRCVLLAFKEHRSSATGFFQKGLSLVYCQLCWQDHRGCLLCLLLKERGFPFISKHPHLCAAGLLLSEDCLQL